MSTQSYYILLDDELIHILRDLRLRSWIKLQRVIKGDHHRYYYYLHGHSNYVCIILHSSKLKIVTYDT